MSSFFLRWLLLSKALTGAQGFLIQLTRLQQQSCACPSATPLIPDKWLWRRQLHPRLPR